MKNLWVATWRQNLLAAELDPCRRRQNLVQSIGFTKGGKQYIFIEEVLFLMERGLLMLYLHVRVLCLMDMLGFPLICMVCRTVCCQLSRPSSFVHKQV